VLNLSPEATIRELNALQLPDLKKEITAAMISQMLVKDFANPLNQMIVR
jgi:hypothetical protein